MPPVPLLSFTKQLRAALVEEQLLTAEEAKALRLRREPKKGVMRFQVEGHLPSGQRLVRLLDGVSSEIAAVFAGLELVKGLLRGAITPGRTLPSGRSKDVERAAISLVATKGLRDETERRQVKQVQAFTSQIEEWGLQVGADSLLAVVRLQPKGSRQHRSAIETARLIARAAGIALRIPPELAYKDRMALKPVRQIVSDEEILDFLKNQLLKLEKRDTWRRAKWLYSVVALTGMRMNSALTIDTDLRRLEVGDEIPIWDLKRDRRGRALITIDAVSLVDLNVPEILQPEMVGNISRPNNNELRRLNSIVSDAQRVVREQLGADMAAKFSPRQLRHAATARLLRAGMNVIHVSEAISSSPAMIEATYGQFFRSEVSREAKRLLAPS